MAQPPSPPRFGPSRGAWFALFWIGSTIIYFWLTTRLPDDNLVRAIAVFLLGNTNGSLIPLFNYWFNPQYQEQYIPRHQLAWVIILSIAMMFCLYLALDPHRPLIEVGAQDLGWPLGYVAGYTILYGDLLKLRLLTGSEIALTWSDEHLFQQCLWL